MHETTMIGNLTVSHCMLDSEVPCYTFYLETRECLLYALIGKIRVYTNKSFLGTLGGRASVTEPLAHVVRFPAGTQQTVTVILEGFAADCLIASCDTEENRETKLPYLHMNDTFWHQVGNGTHLRRVGEVPTPPSFRISCGETLNVPGGTSSWPSHANTEDLQLFTEGKTTWEEQFYVVCPAPATAGLTGFYPGGKPVNEIITLNNGDIVPMPLGSHPVTANVETWCWYWWGYCGTALEKQYRKHSHDIGVYKK